MIASAFSSDVAHLLKRRLEVRIFFFIASFLLLHTLSIGFTPVEKNDNFKVYSCSNDSLEAFSSTDVSTSTKASSLLKCAFSCSRHHQCNYALFNLSAKSCEHTNSTSVNKTLHNPDLDPLVKDSCTVLAKVMLTKAIQDNMEKPIWQQIEPQGINTLENVDIVPMKLILFYYKKSKIIPVGYTTNSNSTGSFIIISYADQFSTIKDQLVEPLARMIRITLVTDIGLQNNKLKVYFKNGKKEEYGALINPLGSQSIVVKPLQGDYYQIAKSVSDLTASLLKGHRRIERHPTRLMIDKENNDVHFDMTETFQLDTINFDETKFYFTSVKESAKTRQRYSFRHRMSKNDALPCEVTQCDSSWRMDTGWEKIDMTNSTDALLAAVLAGKEIRVLMGQEISTDVTVVNIYPDNIVAELAQYLIPFKGSDSQNATEQRVRYPMLMTSKTLVECEMEFQGNTVYDFITTNNHPFTVEWYVTSKIWKKLLVVDCANKKANFGNLDDLRYAITQGNNIRICSIRPLRSTCYDVHSMTEIREDGEIIVQSPPFFQKRKGNEGQIIFDKECARKTYIISSKGTVSVVKYVFGATSNSYQKTDCDEIHWFAEMD